MQSAHGLLDGRVGIEAVDPQDVDIVGSQPLERGLERREDGRPGEAYGPLVCGPADSSWLVLTKLVDVVFGAPQAVENRIRLELLLADAAPELGHEHQLVPRDVVGPDGLGNDALGIAVGVGVGRVPLAAVR